MAERTQKQKPAPSRTEETVEEAPATAASATSWRPSSTICSTRSTECWRRTQKTSSSRMCKRVAS